MKSFLINILLLISIFSYGQTNDSIIVTYIANSGYLIELGSKNILIDAVFNQCVGNYHYPDSSLTDKIFKSESPFEKVDFVLVTHNHPDHVSDSLIIELIKKRDDFELIIPHQVYTSIKNKSDLSEFEKRIHIIRLDTSETTRISFDHTQFDIARSKHADTYEIENLCYIINDKGFRILHTGDCWPESIIDIEKEYFHDIDLAIIPISFGKDRFVAHDSILKPRYTIISHIKRNFADKFKKIIGDDTVTFSTKDVLFEHYDQILYKR